METESWLLVVKASCKIAGKPVNMSFERHPIQESEFRSKAFLKSI